MTVRQRFRNRRETLNLVRKTFSRECPGGC